jgi:hypothetical protein
MTVSGFGDIVDVHNFVDTTDNDLGVVIQCAGGIGRCRSNARHNRSVALGSVGRCNNGSNAGVVHGDTTRAWRESISKKRIDICSVRKGFTESNIHLRWERWRARDLLRISDLGGDEAPSVDL